MMRLTGTLLFSLMCLMPLGAESVKNTPPLKADCPPGKSFCSLCGTCTLLQDCPSACGKHILPLKKEAGTIYSLEEGGMIKCEGDRPLLPITIGTETLWSCGTVEKK